MGLRARELLDAGLDDLSVESRAGLRPPLSCMNDGLQVATGASLGRGTIAVDGRDPRPEAWFAARERRLGLRLRSAVRDRVEAGFRAIRERHGGGTAVAEDASRQEAIRLWLELDRREIFEEVPGP
jgi:pyrimidine-specific ribonucleoside hydrolase